MSDDETKKDSVDETQDEAPQDAGPVAGSDDLSSQAAGESPDPTPPASEAPADEAPAAETPAPAAEAAPEKEPDPEDDLPWKERRRLQRSRRPSEAKPTLSPEERAAARVAGRKKKAG